MPLLSEIIKTLDDEIISKNLSFLSLPTANKVLLEMGILTKEEVKKGALKKLLESKKISNAYQTDKSPNNGE